MRRAFGPAGPGCAVRGPGLRPSSRRGSRVSVVDEGRCGAERREVQTQPGHVGALGARRGCLEVFLDGIFGGRGNSRLQLL